MSDNILKESFLFVPKFFSPSVLCYEFMEVSQGKRPHRNFSILPCETLPCDILPCDMLPCDIVPCDILLVTYYLVIYYFVPY